MSTILARVSSGAAWTDVSQELGPMSRTCGTIIVALSVNPSETLEASTRRRIEDIRDYLDASTFTDSVPSCTLRQLRSNRLKRIASRVLKATPSAGDPRTLPDYLRLVERIASEDKNKELLKEASQTLFTCPKTDGNSTLRGAAAIAFWRADSLDRDDNALRKSEVRSQTRPDARGAAIWEGERRRARGELPLAVQRPALCLAMSGGGVRSAAFQIGVLQGLAELGLLDEVDVAAAVSGGSYALAWLIAGKDAKAVLRSEQALKKLDRRASTVATPFDAAAGGSGTVVTRPIWALSDALGQMSLSSIPNPGFAHDFYEEMLRAAFGIREQPLSSLDPTTRPFPILLATARLGADAACENEPSYKQPFLGEAVRLQRSAFEMTPLGAGSEQLGFSRRFSDDVALTTAVATSGSALDDPYWKYCKIFRTLGVTLGLKLTVWRPEIGGPSPDPLRGGTGPLLLSDGGFADNLGIYPLVRRDCQQIIVVDGTWDPHFTFDEYQRIRKALPSQAHADLESTSLEGAWHSEDCEDGEHCLVKAELGDGCAGPTAGRTAPDAVFGGTLRPLDGEPTPFRYLKLAVDENHLDQYPQAVRDAVKCRAAKARDKEAREHLFPHIPTTRQSLRQREFRALRLLGCYLVEKSFATERKAPAHSPCQPDQ